MKFPRDPLLGASIGKGYQVLEVLRDGDLGREYRGCDAAGTMVTVKVLYGELAAIDRLRVRFASGAQRASTVVHPKVMPVIDVGTTPSSLPFLITPHVQGRRLTQILRTAKRLPSAQVTAILRDLCRGLAAIHKSGMVHGHLCASNIVVEQCGDTTTAIILDLDISLIKATARASYRARAGQHVTGAPYAAPELTLSASHDHRIDLFSIGALANQLRSGLAPFPYQAPQGRIATPAGPQSGSGVGRLTGQLTIESIIRRLLAPDPNDRYDSAVDVLGALDAL